MESPGAIWRLMNQRTRYIDGLAMVAVVGRPDGAYRTAAAVSEYGYSRL